MSLILDKIFIRGRLEDISLEVANGEIVTIFGPEGEGKDDIFKVLTGELDTDSGEVRLDGKAVIPAEKGERSFEDYIIYKRKMESLKGIYIFSYRRWLKRIDDKKLSKISEIMGLDKEVLLSRLSSHLSKGERKRLDLARYLITGREIILLDDPLIGLDWPGRRRTLGQLKEIVKEFDQPCLYQANSQEEVAELKGRVAVIKKGKIEFYGSSGGYEFS
jgi:ABC-type multidrug transport system ATPase subunit